MGIIDFENVRFTYDGQADALKGLNLTIEQGEFACIVGGNGSGKSTLAKHINALLTPDEGSVMVVGFDTNDKRFTYTIRSQAGMIFQNPDDQIVASVIEDDVAFGPENLGVEAPELASRVSQALERVGLQGFEKTETSALSGGQKQRVAIAGTLAMEPRIVVFDEASSMLDPRGRKGLRRVCKELNDEGLTIVTITHFMEEAADADHVIVLEEGSVALEGTPDEVLTQTEKLTRLSLDIPFPVRMSYELQNRGISIPCTLHTQDLARSLTGAVDRPALSEYVTPDDDEGQANRPNRPSAEPLITFDHVSYSYRLKSGKVTSPTPAQDWGNAPDDPWALKDVTLDLYEGEFLGIAGHTGSGKSTLIQLADGLLQPTEGHVFVQGADLSDKHAATQARRNVGVVFQYPERQLFAATVFDDVAFGPRNLGLSAQEAQDRVKEALGLVHLPYDDIAQKSPFALSGGQQRRVAFAGILAMAPSTLILDEPASGLDPKSRSSLLGLVKELHEHEGMTVVMVSHNMDDLAQLSDRIIVLNQGRMYLEGTPAEVFSHAEELNNVGLGVPATQRLASLLGIPQPNDHVFGTIELADVIAGLYRP